MTELEERIHDIVQGSNTALTSNQIFAVLQQQGFNGSIKEVRSAILVLEQKGFLIKSSQPAYFAVG